MAKRDQGRTDGSLKIWGVSLSEEPVKNAEAGPIAEMVQDIEANWLWNAEKRISILSGRECRDREKFKWLSNDCRFLKSKKN